MSCDIRQKCMSSSVVLVTSQSGKSEIISWHTEAFSAVSFFLQTWKYSPILMQQLSDLGLSSRFRILFPLSLYWQHQNSWSLLLLTLFSSVVSNDSERQFLPAFVATKGNYISEWAHLKQSSWTDSTFWLEVARWTWNPQMMKILFSVRLLSDVNLNESNNDISKTIFFIRNILYKNGHALHILFFFSIDDS